MFCLQEDKITTKLTPKKKKIETQKIRDGALDSPAAAAAPGKAPSPIPGSRPRPPERRISSACSSLLAQGREIPSMARHPREPPATAGPQGRPPAASLRAQAWGMASACGWGGLL